MRRWPGLLLALLAMACHDDDGPHAGTLTVSLTTPRTGEGALLVLVAGGPVSAAHSASNQLALTTDSAGTHLLVIGALAAGEVARLDIPDIDQAGRYVAVVEQVAHGTSYTLLDPAGYQVKLRPAETP